MKYAPLYLSPSIHQSSKFPKTSASARPTKSSHPAHLISGFAEIKTANFQHEFPAQFAAVNLGIEI